MRRITGLIFVIITFLFTTTGFCQEKSQINRQINSIFKKEYQNKKFNGNVLVMQNNKTLYEKSFGYADPDQKIKLTKDFKFQIGSVYKEFIAVAVMQLCEKGTVSLEADVNQYIPGLPAWSKKVTIKNLLQYSSGLPKIQFQKYPPDKYATFKEIYSDIVNTKKLRFKPGTSYLYTNYSPLLLMKVVEHVTHQTFTEYAKQHLFDSNDIVIKSLYPYTDTRHLAVAFNAKHQPDPYKLDIPFLFASNAHGMYDWFKRIHQNKLISKRSKFFLGKTADIMSNHHMESPLGIVRICQKPLFGPTTIVEHTHDGSMGNFQCIIRRFNDIDLTIVILTNQKNNNVYGISADIYKIVESSEK